MKKVLHLFLASLLVQTVDSFAQVNFSVQSGAANPLNTFGSTYPVSPTGTFLTGDYNGDGLTDIAVRNATNTGIDMWRNNGNGTFSQLTGTANPFAAINISLATDFALTNAMSGDWDGDGDIDIYNKALNQFYRNDGAAFSVQTGAANPLDGFGTIYPPSPNSTFLTGDFNGDGFTDVVVRLTTNTGVEMWRNNGNGTFTQLTGSANPFAAISFAASASNFITSNTMAGDWDGDGDIDIYNKALNQFYRNDGAAFSVQTGAANPLNTFGTTYPTSPNATFLTGDYNGDGLTDIAVRNATNTGIDMWRNNGNGTFSQLTGTANPLRFGELCS